MHLLKSPNNVIFFPSKKAGSKPSPLNIFSGLAQRKVFVMIVVLKVSRPAAISVNNQGVFFFEPAMAAVFMTQN